MKTNNKTHSFDVERDFEKAIEAVKKLYLNGDLFIYPTDTVYSLGTNPLNVMSIERLKKIVGDNLFEKATFLIDSVSNLIQYIEISSEKHFDFLITIWPNPVKVIFNLNSKYQEIFGVEKVKFKIPNNRFCLRLLTEIKSPLLSVSLNNNEYASNHSYDLLSDEYSEYIDAMFYSNKETFYNESALVDMTHSKPLLIKENKIVWKRYFDEHPTTL